MKREIIATTFIVILLLGGIGTLDATAKKDTIEAIFAAAGLMTGSLGILLCYIVEAIQVSTAAIIAAQISDKFGKRLKKHVNKNLEKEGFDGDF